MTAQTSARKIRKNREKYKKTFFCHIDRPETYEKESLKLWQNKLVLRQLQACMADEMWLNFHFGLKLLSWQEPDLGKISLILAVDQWVGLSCCCIKKNPFTIVSKYNLLSSI